MRVIHVIHVIIPRPFTRINLVLTVMHVMRAMHVIRAICSIPSPHMVSVLSVIRVFYFYAL